MRNWVSLPACRRHASLASTANASLCGQYSSRANVLGSLLYSSADSRTLRHPRSQPGTIRTSSLFGQQLASSQPRRNFSGTPSARITLEEDDDDDPEPIVYNNGRRLKRLSEISGQDVNLRNILSSRASKPKRRPPPKRLDPEQLRKIEEKAQILLVTPQLYEEFVNLKFAPLEDRVSQYASYSRQIQEEHDQLVSALVGRLETLVRRSSERNEILEHEYCTIKFRESAGLENSVAQTENTIASLRHDVFKAVLECSEAFTANLGQMLEVEYLTPRQSARVKIDGLLDTLATILRQYAELQEKGNAARDGFRDIRFLCTQLIKANPQLSSGFNEILNRHRVLQTEFDVTAHIHRAGWLQRHQSRHPLMKSASVRAGGMTADQRFLKINTLDVVRAMMRDGKIHRTETRKLAKRKYQMASALKAGYLKCWNGPKPVDDPFLNAHWRQLDLTAPFDILLAFDSLMLYEIWYLVGTIQEKLGPMWDNLTPMESRKHAERLHQWTVEFRQHQKDFMSEYKAYKQISLIRFEIEKRLHELGEPNDTRERGLFIARNPLSQDLVQFRRWVTRYCSISFHSLCMSKIYGILTLPKAWERLVNKYHAINNARRDRLIQDLGSERARRRTRREHAKRRLRRLRRNRRMPVVARLGRKRFKTSARSMSKKKSLPANQQLAAKAHDAQQSVKAHQAPSATSALHDGMRVRMSTAMRWLKRSVTSSSSESSRTSKPTGEGPRSTQQDHPDRESPTENGSPKTAAQSATTGSQAVQKSSKTRPARFGRVHGEPSKRTYCTDSRVFRAATRKDHEQPLPDQTPASCIPVITEPAEGDPGLVGTIISPNHTIPSPSEPKAKKTATPLFWSHNLHRGPDGRKLIVNYCRSLASTEEVAQHFLKSKVVGFDMEWKAQASGQDSIQNNLSLIQLANEERIALFQIAMFKPARNLQELVAPSLKRVLESPEITKVGVSIKGDSTRLRKHLRIEAQSVFELSHLFKLVKYGLTDPKLVNKRAVNLSEQIEEHFGLPLAKIDDVRCGDWTRALNYRQVQYAATDPFACLCLYHIMEQKRQAMHPMPPRPANAELNMPIVLPLGQTVNNEEKDSLVSDPVDVDVAGRS